MFYFSCVCLIVLNAGVFSADPVPGWRTERWTMTLKPVAENSEWEERWNDTRTHHLYSPPGTEIRSRVERSLTVAAVVELWSAFAIVCTCEGRGWYWATWIIGTQLSTCSARCATDKHAGSSTIERWTVLQNISIISKYNLSFSRHFSLAKWKMEPKKKQNMELATEPWSFK